MKPLSSSHPLVLCAYMGMILGVSMFVMKPILLLFSLFGALLWMAVRSRENGWFPIGKVLPFLLLPMILNPLFSHHGVTILFFLNGNPITLEAVLYGLTLSLMLLSVLLWFWLFSSLMTSDKLTVLFGRLSPGFALLFSMTLRFLPLFLRQREKVAMAQKAAGASREITLTDRIKSGIRVFSVMTTWGLENGIVTADSMEARGYSLGRRSFYDPCRFGKTDFLMLLLLLPVSVVSIGGLVHASLSPSDFPVFSQSPVSRIGAAAFLILSLLPVIFETEDRVRWHFLQSKL